MVSDLAALAGAIAPVGGLTIVFIANPVEAVKIALAVGPKFSFPVFASNGIAKGTVLAIAINALVSATDPEPRIETSRNAVLHMEGTTPQPIGTPGTPNVIAAPVRSLYQTDSVAIRLILQATWGLRTAGAVAWVENVTW